MSASPAAAVTAVLEVPVWRVRLDDPAADLGRCAACLSPEERARAARYRFAGDARRFVVARAALRSILAAHIGVAAAEVALRAGPAGRPELAAGHPEAPRFNLSHSGELAVCALGDDRALGVDVERVRPMPDLEGVMRAVFAPAERARVRAAPAAARARAFFRAWTLKEAWVKARGEGLSDALAAVAILEDRAGRLGLVPRSGEWSFATFAPDAGHVAAVAVEGRAELRVTCRDWRGGVV